jgi:hypothetical protein
LANLRLRKERRKLPSKRSVDKQTPTDKGNALHTKRIATVWDSELACFDLADQLVEKEAEMA